MLDVAGYLDSMNVPAMSKVCQKLGAPLQLMPLLTSFYDGACRYFSFEGSYDPGCHQVRSGFGQGCPLSPIVAAALSHCWCEFVRASCSNIGIQTFMDDRTLWVEPGGSLLDLEDAVHASDTFDQAFALALSKDKCFIAAKVHDSQSRNKTCCCLDLLGVSFSFEGPGVTPKLSLRKAFLRLRLLRWTQAATGSRIALPLI